MCLCCVKTLLALDWWFVWMERKGGRRYLHAISNNDSSRLQGAGIYWINIEAREVEGFGRREINSPIAFSIKTPAGTLLSTAFFLASMESGGALVMSRNTFGCWLLRCLQLLSTPAAAARRIMCCVASSCLLIHKQLHRAHIYMHIGEKATKKGNKEKGGDLFSPALE